jgi:hypothetical protein
MLLLDAPISLFSLSQTSSDVRFGDRNPAVSRTEVTDGTSGNAMKCYIISAGLLLDYLQTSLFIPTYQTAAGIISPLELAKEASNLQYVMGKS